MNRIIKTKFLCYSGFSTAPKFASCQDKLSPWTQIFIRDRWYDGEYELWNDPSDIEGNKHMFDINGGWSRYWVVGEDGKEREMSRPYMKAVFLLDGDKLRDYKIDQILNKE